jgi:UDP-N-acetylglucosamine 2-epimerase (non-hydrolysing)
LGGTHNLTLIEPVNYLTNLFLLSEAVLVVTDSGGIQEEAPSLGKPVLLMRDKTERPEGVRAGVVKLVGTSSELILDSMQDLIHNNSSYLRMSKSINPYGDGFSAIRIIEILSKHC